MPACNAHVPTAVEGVDWLQSPAITPFIVCGPPLGLRITRASGLREDSLLQPGDALEVLHIVPMPRRTYLTYEQHLLPEELEVILKRCGQLTATPPPPPPPLVIDTVNLTPELTPELESPFTPLPCPTPAAAPCETFKNDAAKRAANARNKKAKRQREKELKLAAAKVRRITAARVIQRAWWRFQQRQHAARVLQQRWCARRLERTLREERRRFEVLLQQLARRARARCAARVIQRAWRARRDARAPSPVSDRAEMNTPPPLEVDLEERARLVTQLQRRRLHRVLLPIWRAYFRADCRASLSTTMRRAHAVYHALFLVEQHGEALARGIGPAETMKAMGTTDVPASVQVARDLLRQVPSVSNFPRQVLTDLVPGTLFVAADMACAARPCGYWAAADAALGWITTYPVLVATLVERLQLEHRRIRAWYFALGDSRRKALPFAEQLDLNRWFGELYCDPTPPLQSTIALMRGYIFDDGVEGSLAATQRGLCDHWDLHEEQAMWGVNEFWSSILDGMEHGETAFRLKPLVAYPLATKSIGGLVMRVALAQQEFRARKAAAEKRAVEEEEKKRKTKTTKPKEAAPAAPSREELLQRLRQRRKAASRRK